MERDVATAVSASEAALGHIDVLVNNAGVITTAPLAEMPVRLWDEMIAVNLRSVFPCSKAVLPGKVRRHYGRIINISSLLGHKGAASMAHYAAAQAAIIGFTRSLAREILLGRFGAVREVAPTAVLLASSDGDYFIGATMNINGGNVMV